MKSRIIAAALGSLLLCSAGGCGFMELDLADALRPPKTLGDEAAIEKLISDAAKGSYTLKYPKNGSYRSAISMNDLDGDDTAEAIAFFRGKDETTRLHMLVMRENEGEWSISGDFVTETTDVDCVDFGRVTNSEHPDILVGYTTFTPNVNFLSCYTYSGGETSAVTSGQTYSSFYCGNLDNSGKSKVVTLLLVNAENEAKASMLEYDSKRDALFAKASVAMDGNVSAYKNVVFSDIGDGVKALYVDGVLPNDEINTQVIYYDSQLDVLCNPLCQGKAANPTKRSEQILCTDITGDMKYEIPTVTNLPHNDKLDGMTAMQEVVWNDFDVQSEELVPVLHTVANYSYSYFIKIPEIWQENSFTALSDESGALTRFGEWNQDGTVTNLFDVMVFKITDWDQGKGTENYTLIYKDNRYAYSFVNYNPESFLALSDNEIKTAFSLLGKGSYNSK